MTRGRGRARGRKALSRAVNTRRARESVLIVCEGDKTEPQYFKALCRDLGLGRLVEVVILGPECGSAPISVVDHAILTKKDRETKAKRGTTTIPFDAVWCVCDVEAPNPHETLDSAINKAQGHGCRVALSNPCFEYWYILHFEFTTTQFPKNEDCVNRLRRHIPALGYPSKHIKREMPQPTKS